jgi:xanthine dehydrogenase FAD-binding subunit
VEAYRPIDLKEALGILEKEDLYILNGGTDLMVKKKSTAGLLPRFDKKVMFIAQLEELKDIYINEQYVYIGSGCSYADILKCADIPELVKAPIKDLASPAIRNIATIGGNICNASPAADILPALYALHAKVVIAASYGKKEVPIEYFISGPSKTILLKDELCIEIKIPHKAFDKEYYKKVGTRKATAIAKLSFVGAAEVSRGKIQDIRLSFGAVGPTVVKSRNLEKEIIGLAVKDAQDNLKDIISKYDNIIRPIDDQRSNATYRKRVVLNLLADFIGSL